jgi:plastocyanin
MRILLATFCLLALVSCGGSASSPGEGTEAAADRASVAIEHIAFEPQTLTIDIGMSVTWTNKDEQVTHTVTSGKAGDKGVPGLDNAKPDKPDGTFDAELTDADNSFSFTFDEAGTYAYFCRVHPVMIAEVIVE